MYNCKEGEKVKKIGLVLMSLLVCLSLFVEPVFANEKGSITLELQDSIDELSKKGVEFKICQIAKLVDGFYVLNDEFQDLDIDLNQELKAEAMDELCQKISTMDVQGEIIQTNTEGVAQYFDVDDGIYYIHPTDIHEYETVCDMLVSVPQWQDEDLEYHVVVYPKHSPFEKFVLRKIDSKTKKEILDEVEFTTYKDSLCKEKIKTVTGKGTLSFLLRNEKMYIKETKAPNGYSKSNQVLCVEVKDQNVYVNGKKVESDVVMDFENDKNQIPTGIELHSNGYIILSLFCVMIMLGCFYQQHKKSK